jgi:hypothetical protein
MGKFRARVVLYAGLLALVAGGCSGVLPKLDKESEEKKTQKALYRDSFTDVWRSAHDAAYQLGWWVQYSDRESGKMRAASPRQMGAWSDNIDITISEVRDGVEVEVRGNFAWEPNREAVRNFLDEIRHRL